MRHRFLTADVFTTQRFGGNQLAVFPDARAIPEQSLLPITREFNYSETTFVYPAADAAHTRRVRIFTPGGEIPFAGHPTVGTAHVLAAIGEIRLAGAETRIVLEEGVGPVPVTIRGDADRRPTFAQLSVAKLPEFFDGPPSLEAVAEVLSLDPSDFLGGEYDPQPVSCGLPFFIVPLRTREAVARARVRLEPWERHLKGTPWSETMVFAMDAERADIHARVFVPGLNVPEDPATGSANACLGGYLASRTPRDNGTLRWTVEQGIEMGRPSLLHVEADKQGGRITAVRVGGTTVMVSEGSMEVED
jgi:trans-2,3-dihydro-3-hydroxyanthranilate isomerase